MAAGLNMTIIERSRMSRGKTILITIDEWIRIDRRKRSMDFRVIGMDDRDKVKLFVYVAISLLNR